MILACLPACLVEALAVRVAEESSKPLKRMSTPGDNEKFRGVHRPSGFHNVSWYKRDAKWLYQVYDPTTGKQIQK